MPSWWFRLHYWAVREAAYHLPVWGAVFSNWGRVLGIL